MTFQTDPPGLDIEIDGIRRGTPLVVGELIGFQHEIDAPAQASGGLEYNYSSWSDGGAQDHLIQVGDHPVTFLGTYYPLPLPPGLIAAFGFEEGSGTTTRDSSGREHNGTVQDAAWVTGRFGRTLEFDGVASIVDILHHPDFDLTGEMTLEAWVYPMGTPSGFMDVIFATGVFAGAGCPRGGRNRYPATASSSR